MKVELPINYEKATRRERAEARAEYVKRQGGRCQCCNERLDSDPAKFVLGKRISESLFPKGFFTHPVHLHHSHVTGISIGAVHARCNAYLWQYKGE